MEKGKRVNYNNTVAECRYTPSAHGGKNRSRRTLNDLFPRKAFTSRKQLVLTVNEQEVPKL